MASNNFLTDSVITKRALSVLHNNLAFVKGLNREYSSQFGQSGGKIGQTINVRKPNRYVVQQGPAITPQGTTESTVPLTLDRQWTLPMTFSSKELTLSIDEFDARYITPAVSKLASQIDLDCALAAITGYYADGTAVAGGAGPVNTTIGTPGTTIGTSGGSATGLLQYNAPNVFLNAGLILDNNAAPRDNKRTMALNPGAHANSVGSLTGLFNPQGIISAQYRTGLLGNALGFDFVMDQNMPTFTSGTATSLGNITLTNNAATCTTSISSGTITAGTTFTVAGYYAVNPENQQPTGILQQFVVTAPVTLSVSQTLAISPTPKLAATSVADANCYTSTGAVLGAVAATITSGTGSATSYANSIAYHKEAFTLGTCDLEIPSGVGFGARESMDGISMRILRDYSIMSDFQVCRLDVLGGFATLRPELAVRLSN